MKIYFRAMNEAKPETLLELLRFFDCNALRPYYTGLIADVREELASRGIDAAPRAPGRGHAFAPPLDLSSVLGADSADRCGFLYPGAIRCALPEAHPVHAPWHMPRAAQLCADELAPGTTCMLPRGHVEPHRGEDNRQWR